MLLHLIVVMINDPMLSTWEDGTNVTDKFASYATHISISEVTNQTINVNNICCLHPELLTTHPCLMAGGTVKTNVDQLRDVVSV